MAWHLASRPDGGFAVSVTGRLGFWGVCAARSGAADSTTTGVATETATGSSDSALLAVEHVTRYRYTQPVELAHHLAYLQPMQGGLQDVESHELTITPSLGIAMYPADGESYEELSMRADAAALPFYVTAPATSSALGLHTKAVVVDGERAFVGSPNVDPRSMVLNTEIGVLGEGPEFTARVAALIERDIAPANAWRVCRAPSAIRIRSSPTASSP